MRTVKELESETDLDALCTEIEERRDLARTMVGELYPRMLFGEVVTIIDMINQRAPGYYQTRMDPNHPKKNP